jgi:hypothetical protein
MAAHVGPLRLDGTFRYGVLMLGNNAKQEIIQLQ